MAIGDGNAVKVVDNNGIMLWQQPRNYLLNLKDSNISEAIGFSERNKLLWEQHNPKDE